MEKLLLKRKKIIKNIELNRKLIIFTCAIFICDATKVWEWIVLFVLFALNSTKTTKPIEEVLDNEIKTALEKEELQFKTKDGKIWITDGVTDLKITKSKYEELIFNREI